jgi:hypothetical protein
VWWETHQINLRRRIETAALMGRRFFISPRVPDAWNKKHYELIENCAADQCRKSKSSPLQQQRHLVVLLHEHHPDFTKHRIRMSLQTPSLPTARVKRDRWFSEIQGAIV